VWMRAGTNGFPPGRPIGIGKRPTRVWTEADLDEWILSREHAPRVRYGTDSVSYHQEGVELTLPELLTFIVQALEQLGVEFKLHAAKPAVPAMASVNLRPVDVSAQMQNAAPNHLGKTATEGAL